MKISELEKYLKEVREEHGDIEVTIKDADTQIILKIDNDSNDLNVVTYENGKRIEISSYY